MDNSVFEILSKMLVGNFNSGAQNFSQQNSQVAQNMQNSQKNHASSYYPDEIFSNIKNQNNTDDQNNTQNGVNTQGFIPNSDKAFVGQASGEPFNQNNLMSILLSMLSGNKNLPFADAISTLTRQNKSDSKSKDNDLQEKSPPSDEIIL